MKEILEKLYYNKYIARLFHTADYCICRALNNCESVLDLGCGDNSPVQRCKNIKYSIGVEAYEPYLDKSKAKGIHTEYILGDILKQEFKPKSFNGVIMLEVLEHLTKDDGHKLLDKIEMWASEVVVLSTPNGFLPQKEIHGNKYQKHLSGWTMDELLKRSYAVYGLSGLKCLRMERDTIEEVDTIKYRPRIFWLIVSMFTQIFTYFWPHYAFEVIYIKRIKNV